MVQSELSVNITVQEHPYWHQRGEYELCYVEGGWLYFTDSLEDQWGDDWDDAPYQHNAGYPYGLYGHSDEDVFGVPVTTGMQAPCHTMNRAVSVKEINEGEIPWMHLPNYDETVEHYAGDTYRDVVSTIELHDGTVYVPRTPRND